MSKRRVLSAGQCEADHQSITHTLVRHFQAEVHPVDSVEEVTKTLRIGHFDLVLVNRIFDADGTSGLEVIKAIKGDETLSHIPVMLVSNYEDAQREAVSHGAELGFGKAALGQPHMLDRVGRHLGERSRGSS